jgi:hypothetical protein
MLACIIHEDFYYNRRYAAATSLKAGGLAARSVNILFQVCLPSLWLRAPVSLGVLAVSSRTLVNTAGLKELKLLLAVSETSVQTTLLLETLLLSDTPT